MVPTPRRRRLRLRLSLLRPAARPPFFFFAVVFFSASASASSPTPFAAAAAAAATCCHYGDGIGLGVETWSHVDDDRDLESSDFDFENFFHTRALRKEPLVQTAAEGSKNIELTDGGYLTSRNTSGIFWRLTSHEREAVRRALSARDSDYVKKVHGGYFDVFVAAFGGGGERWDYFRVMDLEALSLAPNLVCFEEESAWGCFGHQLLCRALGGRVGRAIGGWEIGVKRVNFVENLGKKFKFFGDLDVVPHSASLIEIHQDEVWEVPLEGEIMAYSENTNVEMFAIGEHILGIQGHPEYTKDILLNLIDRLINTNTIDRGFGDEAKKRVDAAEPDRKFWLKICKGFLKGAR
uniref:Glutamine amidotransferase domain-containing protein n=1 Tax=Ananas comosus var. bracteatus TaxID=296719 RepID=A0A6V7PM45_ANACO|nr:unnamed protein product [Ananas comosus var. bracteatus]